MYCVVLCCDALSCVALCCVTFNSFVLCYAEKLCVVLGYASSVLRFSTWVLRVEKGLFVVALRYLVFVVATDAKVALRRVVLRCDALSCLVLCCVVVYGWRLLLWALLCCAIVFGLNSCHELGRCGASRRVVFCCIFVLLR